MITNTKEETSAIKSFKNSISLIAPPPLPSLFVPFSAYKKLDNLGCKSNKSPLSSFILSSSRKKKKNVDPLSRSA